MGKPLRLNLPGNLPRILGCAAALIGVLCLSPNARAQETPPPQGVSRGENFSAKPPAQLFQSDCTGSGCHKSPQGLARTQGFGSLAGFLREHYTNSRESAAALANYLSKLPSGPEPREARTPRGRPTTASTASGGPGGVENESKPEGRASRQRSRPGAKPDDEPATAAHHHPSAEPAETAAKPEAKPETKPETKSSARERRGRQPATAAAEPPARAEPEAAPAPPPASPAPPAPPPAPKQYDIFD